MKVEIKPSDCDENNAFVIKQENAPAPLTEAKTEKSDVHKNLVIYPFLSVDVKEEPQKSPNELLDLNDIHNVSETKNSDGITSDFIIPNDLNFIKQEISETEFTMPEACNLLNIKSDVDVEYLDKPSTSNYFRCMLGQPKQNDFKKKVRRHSCPICKKYYSSLYKRLKHLNKHFWKRWLACEFCGQFYSNKFEYFIHYFNHFLKLNSMHLKECKNIKLSKLKKHKLCRTQGKSNKRNISTKRNNKNTTHIDKKIFKCKICLKQLLYKSSLTKHLTIHSGQKAFKCEICSKEFRQKSNFNDHNKIHTGENMFKCQLCSKQFTVRQSLNRHLKIHNGEKAFQCEICSKQFTQKPHLNQHLKSHTGEKSFKCKICSQQYTSKFTLNRHLKIHTGEKPYQCVFCLKQFRQKNIFDNHLKIHTGENLFYCEMCPKQFIAKQSLSRHLKVHTGEKPFICEICSKQFTRKPHLNNHLKLHIGEVTL